MLGHTPLAAGAVSEVAPKAAANTLSPAGIDPGAFGAVTLAWTQYATAAGIAPGSVGDATTYLKTRYLSPGAIASVAAYGSPFVSHYRRTLSPAAIDSIQFGSTLAAGGIRWIDQAGRGSRTDVYGTPAVGYAVRFVYPPWIASFAAGATQVSNSTQYIAPTGWDAAAIGTQYAHDLSQWLVPSGFVAVAWGVPALHNVAQLVAPVGFPTTVDTFPSTRWGRPDVVNLTQVTTQYHLPSDQDEAFGSPFHMTVENRNRTVTTFGQRSDRFGTAAATLAGVALEVVGLDATAWGAGTFVAYRIRTVTPTDPIGPETFTRYNAVIPTPQLFVPSIRAGGYGTPAVSNTRRYYNVPLFETTAWGVPFVAPRVRTLGQYWPWEGVFGTPGVQLGTRYLQPVGFERSQYGVPVAYGHRNEITPRWTWAHDAFGNGTVVRNVTPQLYENGRDQAEYGTAEVRWNPYPLRPAGLDATRWGGTLIEHREKRVTITGIDRLRFGLQQVRNDVADPPAPQAVPMDGFDSFVAGAQVVENLNRAIYPGGITGTFGAATVTLIGAICTGWHEETFGTPWARGPQYATAAGIGAPDVTGLGVTKHRMSPFTIYCSAVVPDGYTTESGGEWKPVDFDTSTWPAWGLPEVSNQFRRVHPSGDDSIALGSPAVELKLRRLLLSGIPPRRVGFPTIPGPQTVGIVPWLDDSAVGDPLVELKTRTLAVPSTYATLFGIHRAEPLNRTVAAAGWDSSQPGDDRIHYPEPIIPGMGVQTLWGDAFIAARIRTVAAQGFDSFEEGFSLGAFDDRMRVAHRYGSGRLLFPPGAASTLAFGAVAVAGSYGDVLAPIGIGDEESGIGTITHADNMDFVCGHAPRAIPPQGFDAGNLGTAGVAHG